MILYALLPEVYGQGPAVIACNLCFHITWNIFQIPFQIIFFIHDKTTKKANCLFSSFEIFFINFIVGLFRRFIKHPPFLHPSRLQMKAHAQANILQKGEKQIQAPLHQSQWFPLKQPWLFPNKRCF